MSETIKVTVDAIDELLRDYDRQRKAHKSEWLFYHGSLNGEPVAIKSFDTWIQVATYRGLRDGGPIDCSVGKMREWLRGFLSR